MNEDIRGAVIAVALLSLFAGSVHAATWTVLGKTFQIKNPSTDASKRRVSGQALERGSNDGLVGDPTVNGATLEVIANGGTPMCHALGMATSLLQSWTSQHANSFPPVVINISDGEATDGDLSRWGVLGPHQRPDLRRRGPGQRRAIPVLALLADTDRRQGAAR